MNFVLRSARRTAGKFVRRVPFLRRQLFDSTDYRIISEDEARRSKDAGWMRGLTALRQERAYQALLRSLRHGDPRIDFRIAAEAVVATEIANPSILEVGCGNGYYAEVFERLLPGPFSYTGLDYSAAMIASARRLYPQLDFRIGDATRLVIEDGSFDVVFNGVSLMHILDYKKAIGEAARVAKRGCIFHSVPVFQKRETTYLSKYAYGAPVSEIVFNEAELVAQFENCGLAVSRRWETIPYNVGAVSGDPSTAKTFLCFVR